MTEKQTSVCWDVLDPRMWGKEHGLSGPYPVVCHLLDTAAVFRVLWRDVLGSAMRERIANALGLTVKSAGKVTSYWAALHDLGKISPPFQAQVPDAFARIRDETRYRCASGAEQHRDFRHEMATHWALVLLLDEIGYPTRQRARASVAHQVAQLLGGHHGRFGGLLGAKDVRLGSAKQPGLGEEGWTEQRRAHFHEVRRVLGAHEVPSAGLPAELAVVIAGLVVVSDWLASQTPTVQRLLPPPEWRGEPEQLDAHFARSRSEAEELVRRSRLGRVQFDDLPFDSVFPYSPNPLQLDIVRELPLLVEERGPGLVLVTAPTGDGKTEAALFAASVLGRAADARGLYFALPTMATADGMFPRVRDYAGKALSGERALTLLHSMSWLSPVYEGGGDHGDDAYEVDELDAVTAGKSTVVEADGWLRGAKRPLLASLGVGTIDQALSAMLPITHNALRLFGLSEKVLIVDEAHAYGPWMHQHLTLLLEWLGAMRAPVVLLSATLTGRTAASLVDAYRRGAGFGDRVDFEPRYPGWLFTDALTGRVSEPRATGTLRKRTLEVDLRMVRWDTGHGISSDVVPGGRRAALREVLAPVVSNGGTALTCCTTVAEAQQTFRDLCLAFPELAAVPGGIRLLHSRFPAEERQRISEECERTYGKPKDESVSGEMSGKAHVRPASILVATQVVEQSLDLDFDLVVSDLAPLAQLLQRAGRGCRHSRGRGGRPAWVEDETRPRLVVLAPTGSTEARDIPRAMAAVYDPGLLVRTVVSLRNLPAGAIEVPSHVQPLVDEVYAEDFVHRLDEAVEREQKRMDLERAARDQVEQNMAEYVQISSPADVRGDLSSLSTRDHGVTEDLLTTRLGAETGRVLCLYEQPGGRVTLDRHGKVPPPDGWRSKPTRDSVKRLMAHVTPVPGTWIRAADEAVSRPASWKKQPLLRELVLLPMRPAADHTWSGEIAGSTVISSQAGLEQA